MYTADRNAPTTPAGQRVLSNAVAFKIIQRLAQLELHVVDVEVVEDMIADALKGRHFSDEHRFSNFARQAVLSRDAIEKYLARYHADMVKLGAPAKICQQELLYQLKLLQRIGVSAAEASCAVKH